MTEVSGMLHRPDWIDTHVHFWDLRHPEVSYDWLGPDAIHPILGAIDQMKSVRYDLDALHAESRFAGTVAAVHVQAAVGTPDPVLETEWLTELAAAGPIPLLIVAALDLAAADVDAQLDRHLASPLVRGVRDFGRGDYLVDPAWRRGVARLAERGLLLDLDCAWQNMIKARDLAREHPSAVIVLEHLGYPRETASPEYFEHWKQGITALAEADNVHCKISGLGMNRAGWTPESLRPWVEHCLDSFTPDRCVLGSNWPLDRLWASYPDYVDALNVILARYTEAEARAVRVDNARRLYRFG
ncbi:amidohydrolase family protein [Microlunatus sp. GCM10028923]|uniref:amidohydrolase family protein n=1 Tax=Microlunatus sp. GCM10028923 TaxID=3273400 RepID=UPI00361AADEB